MAGTKSNGVSAGERRRKPRGAGAGAGVGTGAGVGGSAAAPADGAWLGRLDALADRLALLDDRGTIVEQVVSETMQLLPAAEVRVYADAEGITSPAFIEENEQAPARAVIPLAIAGRHFGAVEIAMKPRHAVGAGERALSLALARQCALAIDSLMLRQARREAAATAATARPPPVVEPALAAPEVAAASPIAAIVLPVGVPVAGHAPLDLAVAHSTLARLEADLRALAKLARSAELPPSTSVDRAEQTALRRLDELRVQLSTVEDAA